MRRLASRLVLPALLAPSAVALGSCGRRDAAPATNGSAPADTRQVGNSSRADPASPARVLGDSAAALDARFQSLRDSLNRESRALDPLDRRSADYARRFDAWRAHARTADSLRVARDRLRTRLARLAH